MSVVRPDPKHVCVRCQSLLPLLVDISAAGKSGTEHTTWWNETFGRVGSIKGLTPRTCELCAILHRGFATVPGFDSTHTEIAVEQRGFATHEDLRHNTCEFKVGGSTLALAPAQPVVQTKDGELMQAFTARPILSQILTPLVQLWIGLCLQHPKCRPEVTTEQFDFPFRLIDVQEGRLVDAPSNAQFVALSYVWGGVRQVTLTTTTRHFLDKPGAITSEGLGDVLDGDSVVQSMLDEHNSVVPRTICDAIRLCLDLGQRYLWVDSLCILQDDEIRTAAGAWTNADKLAQIPHMDKIYGASALTVIAACGDDANAGLSGVRANPRPSSQVMGKIGDQLYVSVHSDPMSSFWTSTWCERAWTFQEFLLSKRRLIFLPEQAVFQCNTSAWCEDLALEFVINPDAYSLSMPSWTANYRLSPLKMPDRLTWNDDVFFPAIFLNKFWCEWLRNYLRRRLTVAEDVLFAFDGALSSSRRFLGDFHYGLPVRFFCESLSWSIIIDLMHQGYHKNPYHGLQERRQGFPSWSWTGWIWNLPPAEGFHIDYGTSTPDRWSRVGVWATRTGEDGNVTLWQISAPDMTRWKRLDFAQSPKLEVDEEWMQSHLPTYLAAILQTAQPLHALVFKTLTAMVWISPQRLHQYENKIRAYATPDFSEEGLVGGIGLSEALWLDRIHAGLQMQLIITGECFSGPSPRFPDQSDEMNPSIKCLVIKPVLPVAAAATAAAATTNDDITIFERVTVIEARLDRIRQLQWSPLVAILQ